MRCGHGQRVSRLLTQATGRLQKGNAFFQDWAWRPLSDLWAPGPERTSNPAVSAAFALHGDFPRKRVPAYIVAQFAGAVLAWFHAP